MVWRRPRVPRSRKACHMGLRIYRCRLRRATTRQLVCQRLYKPLKPPSDSSMRRRPRVSSRRMLKWSIMRRLTKPPSTLGGPLPREPRSKSAAPLEPPTADSCAAPTRLEPLTADSRTAPMRPEPPTADTRAAPTRLEPPTAEWEGNIFEAAHLQPPTMGVGPLEPPKFDSWAAPFAVPAAAALNSSAASSPRPLVAPRVPMLSPSPSPLWDLRRSEFHRRLCRKFRFSRRGFGLRHHSNPRHRRPSIDVVREGSRRWDNTAVGYFLGRKPYYHHLNEYVRSVWPAVKTVTATSNGFYFFQFKTEIAMEEVIEGGPWLFQGQPIVLQRWEPGMVLRKHKHTQVPVWIRLRHLPVEFWTDDGLSTVASGVGRPLYQDTITRACTRLDFARVCVMLDISSTLPKHLIIMMPREDGTEVHARWR
ncbi:hypothetical protein Sango_3051100 [Sesamum angolense]|uniref:DUF4283 domain-containing protein n=1 Tax=Sesamum angolense TaxID=2727404 RepID=A0AAE1VZ56_9LAMI|nr:hypothetical protein Sango_3051100 [Sesamum angolense]